MKTRCPPALPWTRIERIVAGVTTVNGALGLAVWALVPLSRAAIDALALLALLGLLSGILAWRGRLGGHGAGLAFHGLQLAGYHSYDATQVYHLRGALSLAFVMHLPAGVLVVNVFALVMLAASAALLWRHLMRRQSPAQAAKKFLPAVVFRPPRSSYHLRAILCL